MAGLGDIRTIELAQRLASEILADDPGLDRPRHAALAARLAAFWAERSDAYSEQRERLSVIRIERADMHVLGG